MAKPIKSKPPTTTLAVAAPPKLLNDLRALISQSRQQVAQAINSVLVMLYWQVGHRIRTDVLREKRADYGKEIVHALSGQLVRELEAKGTLTDALFEAQERTIGEMEALTKKLETDQRLTPQQAHNRAWEMIREKYILPAVRLSI